MHPVPRGIVTGKVTRYPTLDTTANANSPTYSNGDLRITATSASGHATRSTISFSSEKHYFEFLCVTKGGGGYQGVGVCTTTQSLATPATSIASVPSGMWVWRDDAVAINNGSSAALGSAWSTNDIIMVAVDMGARAIWWGRNGSWSGDPVAGTGAAFTGLPSQLGACINLFGNSLTPSTQANFGAGSPAEWGRTAFTYPVPGGYRPGIFT